MAAKKLEEVHVGVEYQVSPTGKPVCVTRPDGEVITVSYGLYIPTQPGEHEIQAGNGKSHRINAVCPPGRGTDAAS
jgi:hypothetical protein